MISSRYNETYFVKNQQESVAAQGHTTALSQNYVHLNHGRKSSSGLVTSIASDFVFTAATLLPFLANQASDGGSVT